MAKSETVLVALLVLLLAVATILILLSAGSFDGKSEWVKPTTNIMEPMRRTATAEAEQTAPILQLGQKSRPGAQVTPARLSQHSPAPLQPQASASPAQSWLLAVWAILWTRVMLTGRRMLRTWAQFA